jgi:diguanylate cyclase (GGDEF)-like protein/PAS domain S-box-containing protein
VKSATALELAVLAGIVFVALASTHVAGRRAGRTVDRVTDLLERNEARFRAMVRDSSDIMAIVDAFGHLTYASPATQRILGLDSESLVGTSAFDLIHRDDRPQVLRVFEAAKTDPHITDGVEFRMQHADGSWRIVEAVSTNLLHDPSIQGLVISLRDVTDRRSAEADLREAQERFRSAFEHAPIGMALMALDGKLFRVNRAMVQILGRSIDELLNTTLRDLTHADDRESCAEALGLLLSSEAPSCQLELRLIHHGNHPVWVSLSWSVVRDLKGNSLYLVCQVEDIGERKASGEALAHQAIHDPLTGLPNRLLFVDRLGRELTQAANMRTKLAVLFLDLDRFKVVNDSLGHSAGDRLLVAIADRLSGAMRPNDVVARFGGDEFTVVCRNVTNVDSAELIAERLARQVAEPVALVEGEVFVTASIGIAISDGRNETPETLLRNADAAMYRAKELGRDRVEVFEAPTHHRAVDDLRTGNALHRAIERGELRMYYQPIIDLEKNRITGFEALIRWQHPERGLVPPSDFIPLAEETGLIVPLGAWALETSSRQAAHWHTAAADGRRLSISVNLSPRQLAEPSLPNEVARILGVTGLHPDSLWLEITETTLMRDAESALSALGALRALGLHLAVDDFGSGYSSMAYLERLPVESLKIDRTFVSGVGQRSDSTAITKAIVSLAHALRMKTVAEGIELPQQLDLLRSMGCAMGQGYLFGRPQPAEVYGPDPTRITLESEVDRSTANVA